MLKSSKWFLGLVLGLLTSVLLVNPLNAGSKVDIVYGGQYYPEEFVLKGYTQLWEKYNLKDELISLALE